jgi:DNA (cytosine-5)-methyltransferase 1
MTYKLGSLFDGSGGFPLAGSLCGIEPIWAAEVEPYPIAVTRSRFPNMKHLGDISKINGAEVEPVDIITFGSPCQDLSVAGKRAGLKHEANGDEETTRSGLFMEAVRIIREMREATNGAYPRFALWENVPGAFSSNKGEDFRIVLEELIKIVEPSASMPPVPKNGWPYADSYCGDGWSLAYRVFDAQYFGKTIRDGDSGTVLVRGTPQRRRRIHLVLDLAAECAREVSFEREGVRGYFAQSREKREAVAGDAENCSGATDREGIGDVIPINTMIATRHKQLGRGTSFGVGEVGDTQFTISAGHEHAVCYALDQQGGKGGANYAENVMPTLCSDSHGTPHAVAYSFDSLASNSMKSSNPHSGCRRVEVAKTLDTTDPNPSKNQGGIAIVESVPYTLKIRSGCEGGGKGALIQTDMSATLATNNDQYLFQPMSLREENWAECDVKNALRAGESKSSHVVLQSVPNILLDDQGGQQINVRTDDKSPTLRAEMHGNVPMVMEPVAYNGENITSPLNKTNPQPGDPCHTIGTDSRNYVVIPTEYAMQGFGDYKESDVASGLKARDYKDATDLVAEVSGVDCRNLTEHPELYPTLQAKPNGGQSLNYSGAVRVRYIVRRLTPTECARLQGFPDKWGHPDAKEDFTDEEYRFWLEVRNTHATVIGGKEAKDYTKAQMLTWYNKLHTDSAEYKMWGNGIALPPALYLLQGMADVLNRKQQERTEKTL